MSTKTPSSRQPPVLKHHAEEEEDETQKRDCTQRGKQKKGESWQKENERSQQEWRWLCGLPELPKQAILTSECPSRETIDSLELAKKLAEENLSLLARPGLPISLEPARQVLADVQADPGLVTAQSWRQLKNTLDDWVLVQCKALGGANLQSDGGGLLGGWLVDAVYDYARVIFCLCAAQLLQLFATGPNAGYTHQETFTYDGTDFSLNSTQHTRDQWKLLVGSRTRSKGARVFSDIHAEMVGE